MGEVNIIELDLYELLGINQSSTTSEVKKAYRKKALSCHPDKNPDDAKAAERFHTLSKALEILIDVSARAAYDKVFNAKREAKVRHNQLDAKRKKLKEDLEAKELASMKGPSVIIAEQRYSKTDEEKLKAEIERLRKQGSRELKEEMERVNRQVEEEWRNRKRNFDDGCYAPNEAENGLTDCRLRLRWDMEIGKSLYNEESITKIFTKYGPISAIVLSSKQRKHNGKGSGIIEFENAQSAVNAMKMEKGFKECPLTIEYLRQKNNTEKGPASKVVTEDYKQEASDEGRSHFSGMTKTVPSFNFAKVPMFTSFPVGGSSSTMNDSLDFENLVLRRLRQAQERKRLEEEIRDKDNESG